MKPTIKLLSISFCLFQTASAALIFQDSFSGSDGVMLNGKTPDTSTTGANWQAATVLQYDGNGNIESTNGAGGATLALPTVASNETITISATIRPLATQGNFIGIGLYNAAAGGTGDTELSFYLRGGFSSTNPANTGSIFKMEDGAVIETTSYTPATSGTVNPFLLSMTYNLTTGNYTMNIDSDVVFSGNYNSAALSNISHAGFVFNKQNTSAAANPGQVSDFSVNIVPEPSSFAMICLGAMGFVMHRRRK